MQLRMRVIALILVISSVRAHHEPCTEYGCPGRPQYEPFVPAPPGHTPSCAKPGQTFCETPDHYPRQLIKFLVDKCSFDFKTALKDESQEDFNTYRSVPDYPVGYDYTPQEGPRLPPEEFLHPQYPDRGQPALVYGVPSNHTEEEGYRYSTPAYSQRNPFLPEITSTGKYYRGNQGSNRPFYSQAQSLTSFGQDQQWPNRYVRNNKVAPRTFHENPLLGYGKVKRERTKRQSGPDSIALCPTEAHYISPRAALNNQGNWMYVVNLQDRNQKYSQVVKSEKCTTDMCNGVCSVPAGYTSRCQQQYVQKRLVALEGSGNRLYTDVFWFPHGCSCEIMLNY